MQCCKQDINALLSIWFDAAAQNDVKTVQSLYKQFNSKFNEEGLSALHLAILNQSLTVIQFLLPFEAELQAKSDTIKSEKLGYCPTAFQLSILYADLEPANTILDFFYLSNLKNYSLEWVLSNVTERNVSLIQHNLFKHQLKQWVSDQEINILAKCTNKVFYRFIVNKYEEVDSVLKELITDLFLNHFQEVQKEAEKEDDKELNLVLMKLKEIESEDTPQEDEGTLTRTVTGFV
ncbi:Ankyrin_repeat-containing protein [Hexamita inflata]|uniref:Ankyrin repeat-containing protein n=1 Tax=Hexamita inflata TaxID=28002 RepID=A0AA86Q6N3_9EUKA|nr:Ankyrin repeat-containing protein [Hexamita inflata]